MRRETMDKSGYAPLAEAAWKAAEKAYCPYSGFHVGAALQTAAGAVYTGCNIENIAYGPTNCAERTAIFKAVSEGERSFSAIAVVGSFKGRDPEDRGFSSPCGVCRQVMLEFCDPEKFEVVLANGAGEIKIYTLGELAPESFSPYKKG